MNTPHELAVEFPEERDLIRLLKQEDGHFEALTTAYSEINRRIFRIESLIEPASNETLADLRDHRAQLKEEIAACLAASKCAVA